MGVLREGKGEKLQEQMAKGDVRMFVLGYSMYIKT